MERRAARNCRALSAFASQRVLHQVEIVLGTHATRFTPSTLRVLVTLSGCSSLSTASAARTAAASAALSYGTETLLPMKERARSVRRAQGVCRFLLKSCRVKRITEHNYGGGCVGGAGRGEEHGVSCSGA